MLRQLEMRVKAADKDHRDVVKPALQLMICLIARVKKTSCSDNVEEKAELQAPMEATCALLQTWNSKLCIRERADKFIKVRRLLEKIDDTY